MVFTLTPLGLFIALLKASNRDLAAAIRAIMAFTAVVCSLGMVVGGEGGTTTPDGEMNVGREQT